MKIRKLLLVVALWMGHHFCFGQQLQFGAGFTPYLNLNRGSIGQGASGDAFLKTSSHLWIGYGFSYLSESDKVRSYGNPIADGVGYEQSLKLHSVNGKFFIKRESRFNPYAGLGFVYARWKYNNKQVLDNVALETTSNSDAFGLTPVIGIAYKSPTILVFDTSLKAVYLKDSPVLQLTFGLLLSL